MTSLGRSPPHGDHGNAVPDAGRRSVLAGVSALGLTSLLPSGARATGLADTVLLPDAMRRDVDILYDAYTSLHPGLYRYETPEAVLHERERLGQFAAEPRSLGEFYLALSAFTASIRCGHSFPNPSNQTPAVAHALFDRPDRLPWAFVWLDQRMVVTRDLGSGHQLPAGAEIVTIDGVPTREMLARMLPYARTDGSNDARKRADLGIPGDASQPSFDTLRSLLFPSPMANASLRVRARWHGQTGTIDCRPMRAADRDAALKPAIAGSPYGWRFSVEGRVGLLTMPTWAVFHEPWDWTGYIDDSIDAAIDRQLTGIVIDLRDNGGGLDCGAAVVARLIDRPLTRATDSRHVRYRAVPERLSPYLKTWDPSFRDWGASARGPDADGDYLLDDVGHADANRIVPTKRRYAGKAVVLVGPANASATFGFALLVQRHRLATLVGEPTGGNLRGINGGAFFFVHLPATGIEVDLPLIGYRPTGPQPDAGVTPDVLVPRRAADLRAGRDRAMERAVAIASA